MSTFLKVWKVFWRGKKDKKSVKFHWLLASLATLSREIIHCEIATTSSFREGKEGKLSTSFFPYMWPCFAPSEAYTEQQTNHHHHHGLLCKAEYWRTLQGQILLIFKMKIEQIEICKDRKRPFLVTTFIPIIWLQ